MQRSFIILLTFCTLMLFIGLLPVHGEAELYDNVIRLHVIANSDSEHDQALKLKVRDAVLASMSGMLGECKSIDEAIGIATEELACFERIALDTVRKEGYAYEVKAELGMERYPTRSYGEICFPAGEYISLRITLGSGEGQNWWCVLFPPMCLSAASGAFEYDSIPVGLTGEQYKLITETDEPRYAVRFKILELLGK